MNVYESRFAVGQVVGVDLELHNSDAVRGVIDRIEFRGSGTPIYLVEWWNVGEHNSVWFEERRLTETTK